MVKVHTVGTMEECTMVTITKTRSKGMEFTCGQMGEHIWGIGLKGFKMISEFTYCQMVKLERVDGKAKIEKNGCSWMKQRN